ncbi:hypothetical protein U27_06593 [Candidatus Vecturithrix granuli]|uniref:Uncharacterized protein n=1 Tax=Vecturithrix granuli TaxID=1499967 RepID=A0A081C4V3_VECG1|nr:hypothetical protein U27_06593 [Candidatus Vecturithrix granuli]
MMVLVTYTILGFVVGVCRFASCMPVSNVYVGFILREVFFVCRRVCFSLLSVLVALLLPCSRLLGRVMSRRCDF